jgi:glycosidase
MFAVTSAQGQSTANINPIPEWANGYPLYEVFVRDITPEGTFKALERLLPELRSYGIKNIWLMPIHPIGEKGRKGSLGCPYSVRDYFEVNPEYGTREDFKDLVKSIHNLGMRIIIDFVANHCANDHIAMREHPEMFTRDSLGNFTREVADWSDVTDWDFDNPETVEYLERALLYWVKEFDIDGYRCDVAGMVPDSFWLRVIPKMKAIKPEIFMLAEWETPEMHLDSFNATYDWNLYHRMVLHHEGEISADSLWEAIEWREKEYPPDAVSLRFIENHDQERAMSIFGEEYRLYASLVFTLPGIPLIYNGQEFGALEKPSLFEKETINREMNNPELYYGYKSLLELRNNPELIQLREGDLNRVGLTGASEVLAYRRAYQGKIALILINFSNEVRNIKLPLDFYFKTRQWDYVNHQSLFSLQLNPSLSADDLPQELTLAPYAIEIYTNNPR